MLLYIPCLVFSYCSKHEIFILAKNISKIKNYIFIYIYNTTKGEVVYHKYCYSSNVLPMYMFFYHSCRGFYRLKTTISLYHTFINLIIDWI